LPHRSPRLWPPTIDQINVTSISQSTPIGNIPPAEAEERYYTILEQPAMAA
jgi:hypothetical protein